MRKQRRSGELPAVGDGDTLGGLAALGADLLDAADNVEAGDDVPEDHVDVVEPLRPL